MLNVNHVGSALGLTLGILFAVCSVLFIAWPLGYMGATGMMYHGFALDSAPHAMNLPTFIFGPLFIAIIGYVAGALYAIIFNLISAAFRPIALGVRTPR